MKKTYIAPQAVKLSLETSHVVATSPSVVQEKSSYSGGQFTREQEDPIFGEDNCWE